MRLCCAAVRVLLLAGCLGLAVFTAPAAESAKPRRYHIPAGPAEAALKQFAVQSGRQILFPTDAVAGLTTNAVQGRYTMTEALDLLLAGAPLFVREDALTGAISVGRLSVPKRVIELPLLVVTEQRHAPWRYATVPGLEVLSRCPDEATQRLIAQNQRLLSLLEMLVPARFQVRSVVPAIYVLYGAESQPGLAREIIASLAQQRDAAGAPAGAAHADWSVQVLPNYRFWDQDSLAIFFILSGADLNKGNLTLTPDYLRYRLEARTPALPAWFVEGMVELYGTVTLEPGLADADDATAGEGSGVVFWPMRWTNEAETEAIRQAPRAKHAPPDLHAILAGPPAPEAGAAALQRWRLEAALFIRWVMADLSGQRREALWRWLDRPTGAPADESAFRDCFGLGYAEMTGRLADYLPDAVTAKFVLPLVAQRPPAVTLRDATATEISRLKGDLERLEIPYVEARYPQLTEHYTKQARRTLRAAYDQGDRDPRLLAVLGLFETESGDDGAARPLLEEAVAQHVPRPRAYYELARLYFQELRSANPDGRFSVAEAGRILAPLAEGRRLAPPLPETYELIAEVWLRSEGRLMPKQLGVLDEGITLFPRRVRLIYSAALLQATHGDAVHALALVERGLRAGPAPEYRERLEKLRVALRESLAANPPAPAKGHN